ncbi:MAG: hypothetical protein AAFS10_19975 [Myxococcota bacterium]
MPTRCYQHEDGSLMAYCAGCARACCQDCVLEVGGHYYCERCRDHVAADVYQVRVLPEARNALFMSMIAVVLGVGYVGLLLGPYAIWRAHKAQMLLDDAYWIRGQWHVRAAKVLGGCAVIIGAVTLMQ